MKLLIVAAASLAVVSCAIISLEDLEFHAWKLKFGKVYSSPEEEARRKDIWLSTRRRVLAHNILADQGIKTYHMGMNHLSDMAQEEYVAFHSMLQPGDLINSTAQCDVEPSGPVDGGALPPFMDWRDSCCVTPVKHQGKCGSCWAFSAVGAVESHTCIKHKRLTRLSEQQLIDCSGSYGNHGCTSGSPILAFKYCIDNGIVPESFYQYKAKVSPCRFKDKPIPTDKIRAKCLGFCHLEKNELKLQNVVAERGPVSINIPVHDSFYNYDSGVYECGNSSPRGHHSMLVVGYGSTEKRKDYWLVKNSYGHLWGEGGYIRIARNKNNNCGIATEAFYPVVA